MVRSKGCKYLSLIFILFMVATILGGCGPSKKEVLSQYRQSVQPILSEMAQISEKWDTLRRKNGNGQVSDLQFAIITQKEIAPALVSLQERMEAIEPHKDLRATHELGIKIINKNLQAMNEVVAAVFEGNMSKITSANGLMAEARELERKYVNQLEDFIK